MGQRVNVVFHVFLTVDFLPHGFRSQRQSIQLAFAE